MITRLKSIAEWGLLRCGPAAYARRTHRSRDLILAYHNVVPDGASGGADASLHMPQRCFAEQLDILIRGCDVVPLANILAGRQTGRRPRVAITFDDGYAGALTVGLQELLRRGLPATIFVTPGRLGGQAFWWDSFTERNGRPIAAATRAYLLESLAGDEAQIAPWAGTHLNQVEVPDVARTVDEAGLMGVAAKPGVSIGAHSWSHPNLARIPSEQLHRELRDPLLWLGKRLGGVEQVVAFPYGLYSAEVVQALRQERYLAGLAITGGWVPAGGVQTGVVPRYNVPAGLSAYGFALRLSGLLAA